ncbi:UNVERIFIED_CONTAM: hypothetical protein HDU68_000911 [Siphonaria sp. JEL0065]|nr:hypothetical protein HDU68_000911 [Siphonaria sp. JEL0065]
MRGVALIFFPLRFIEISTFPRSFTAKWRMLDYYEFIGVSDNEPIRRFVAAKHNPDKLSKTDSWRPKVAQYKDRTLSYYLYQTLRLGITFIVLTLVHAVLEKYKYKEYASKLKLLNVWDFESVLVNVAFGVQLFTSMDILYTFNTLVIVNCIGAPYTPIFDKPYFSTSLRDFWSNRLPTEVVQLIFSHIHPSEALKFKRICKHINACLQDKFFAKMNLSLFLPPQRQLSMLVSSVQPDALDRLWFSFPEVYQNVYARMKLQSLVVLSWWNMSQGSIPKSIGSLTALVSLDLFRSDLSGGIPIEIGKLVHLESLTICLTKVTGSLPAEIGNLIKLERLSICSCSLTGSIPQSFSQLTNLKLLNLCSNGLEGPIPQELGNLSSLVDLNLASNRLSGHLPSSLGKLTNLRHINLNDNCFEGEIPSELGSLTSLYNLQMQRNNLCGKIPESLANLSQLYELNLASNYLQGSFPEPLCSLTNLHFLSVTGNQLTGELPQALGRLNVVHLHLSHNRFQGGIPQGFLKGLRNVRFMSLLPNSELDVKESLSEGEREGGSGVNGHVWNMLLGDLRRHSYQ